MEIKLGKYKHFKGTVYEVIAIAKHSETLEEMVIYRSVKNKNDVWARPASMWFETVERDGKIAPRFEFIEE